MSNENSHTHIEDTLRLKLYSTEQFDKSIIFIASGALGISFAFITDIIPDLKNACYKGFLISSWGIFSLVIFMNLIAHFVSMLAHQWAVKKNHLDDKTYNKKIKRWNVPIRNLNFLCILGIFVGSIFLLIFICNNLII